MKGEGKKKGIKDYADLMITRDDIVKPFESGCTVWDEAKIIDRTANISNEVLALW